MNICPQCGNPFSDDDLVVSTDKSMYCDRCHWQGTADQLIHVDDALTGVENFQSQLELLYRGMAQNVAPHIGKLLIETGLVLKPDSSHAEEDKRRVEFLAKVLQGATRGAIEGMASVIAEEINHGRN